MQMFGLTITKEPEMKLKHVLLACLGIGMSAEASFFDLYRRAYHTEGHVETTAPRALFALNVCDGTVEAIAEVENRTNALMMVDAARYFLSSEAAMCSNGEELKAQALEEMTEIGSYSLEEDLEEIRSKTILPRSEQEHLGQLLEEMAKLFSSPTTDMGSAALEELVKRRLNGSVGARHFVVMTYLNLLEKYQSQYPSLIQQAAAPLFEVAKYDTQTKIRRMAMLGYVAFRGNPGYARSLVNYVANHDGTLVFDAHYNRKGIRYEFVRGRQNGQALIDAVFATEVNVRLSGWNVSRIEVDAGTWRNPREDVSGTVGQVAQRLNQERQSLIAEARSLRALYASEDSTEAAELVASLRESVERKIRGATRDLSELSLNVVRPFGVNTYEATVSGVSLCRLSEREVRGYRNQPGVERRTLWNISRACSTLKRERTTLALVDEYSGVGPSNPIIAKLLADIDEVIQDLSQPVTAEMVNSNDGRFFNTWDTLANGVTMVLSNNTQRFAQRILPNLSQYQGGSLCPLLEEAEKGNISEDLDLTTGERDNHADILYTFDIPRETCGRGQGLSAMRRAL